MPAPSRPEGATTSATQQQQTMSGRTPGLGRRGVRVARARTSSVPKGAPMDAPPAPPRVTAWFSTTAYDLGLSNNHLAPITEHNSAAAPAMPGEWLANMPLPAAEPQARPAAATMMMLMDGRMAAGRAARRNVPSDMGRTHYRHGAPPRAPPPLYKHQPMSHSQRAQQSSRTARSAMAGPRT